MKCSVDLIVGDNWTASMKRQYQYKCKACYSKIVGKYSRTEAGKSSLEKLKCKIQPGIYGVYNNDKLIYIGESNKPYNRKSQHFTNQGLDNARKMSIISYALSKGELQRVNLTFKMLEFIDDKQSRVDRELELQQRYKPLYNEVYV